MFTTTAKDQEKADSQIPHLEEEKKPRKKRIIGASWYQLKKPVMCASSAVSVGLQPDDP